MSRGHKLCSVPFLGSSQGHANPPNVGKLLGPQAHSCAVPCQTQLMPGSKAPRAVLERTGPTGQPCSGGTTTMAGATELPGQHTDLSFSLFLSPQLTFSGSFSGQTHCVQGLQNSPVSSHIYFCTELDPVTRTKLSIRKQITVI